MCLQGGSLISLTALKFASTVGPHWALRARTSSFRDSVGRGGPLSCQCAVVIVSQWQEAKGPETGGEEEAGEETGSRTCSADLNQLAGNKQCSKTALTSTCWHACLLQHVSMLKRCHMLNTVSEWSFTYKLELVLTAWRPVIRLANPHSYHVAKLG